MAEPVLEITLDHDIDIDINWVSDLNPSSESDPSVQQLGQLPSEMSAQDEQTDEVMQLFWVPLPLPYDEDSDTDSDDTTDNNPKTRYNKKGQLVFAKILLFYLAQMLCA